MKGYSIEFSPEECAAARVEGVDASYKDLVEVCGRIRGKNANWAAAFLQRVAEGKAAVLYTRFNKKIGHRHELGGQRGRYPRKAAKIVLKVLKSAMANGMVKGLGDKYTIFSSAANKKAVAPRMAPRGGSMRSNYVLGRIEIVLKSLGQPKKIEITPPQKTETKAQAAKPTPAKAVEKSAEKFVAKTASVSKEIPKQAAAPKPTPKIEVK
ncbi:MAG: 50S ribosomal protein L22 [Candidatus Micrarchaeota archaeon]